MRSARNCVAGRGGRRGAEAKECFPQVRRVVVHDGHEHFIKAFRQFFIQASDHAAVKHPDHTAGQEHQVAGMRVGMVERIAENHLEIHSGAAAGEFIEVSARGGERRGVGAEDAVQPFHRQDTARRERRVSAGEMDGVVLGEMFRELLEIAAFDGEIQLAQEGAAELPDDRFGLVGTQLGKSAFPPTRPGRRGYRGRA